MARSKVKVTFDKRAFERGLKKLAGDASVKIAARLSSLLNGMSAEFEGRPVEEIKPVLQRRWKSAAGRPLGDPRLSVYAEQIAAGGKFNLTADKLS